MTLERVTAWDNLLLAWRKAARGKRAKRGVAAFEHQVADRLLALRKRPANYIYRGPCAMEMIAPR